MPSPPMSMMCAVLANSPTMRPPWKAGVTTVRSCRCPVPSHGSLVMKWSPGCITVAGNLRRKCPTASAIEFTWPGVPVTACASIRPSRSKMPALRSPASRTVVLKAVRIIVCACSSTTAIRRFHWICRWMAARASCVGSCMLDTSSRGADIRQMSAPAP